MAVQCLPCSSSDGDCLAPQGFSPVLELEGAPSQARPAVSATRDSRTDPDHESRKPNVGSSAYSRRAFEAWDRYRRNQRQQIHDPPAKTALTDLEDISGEPCEEYGLRRFLYGADHPISDLVRVSGTGA